MNILFVSNAPAEEPEHQAWRCSPMARAIQCSSPNTASRVELEACLCGEPAAQALVEAAEIIVVQGRLAHPILAQTQRWKAAGKAVLVDLDPECGFPPHPGHPLWGAAGAACLEPPEAGAQELIWALRLVDAAVFPSARLADDWRSYTAQTMVLPDFLDLDRYLNITPVEHEGVILGWRNTLIDERELAQSGFVEGLERVCQSRPYVKIMTWGNRLNTLAVLPDQRLETTAFGSLAWPRPLAYVDIGLAPIAGAIAERRGWADVLEFMAMKIPWLASNSSAYYELRPYGWLVPNSPNAWERLLHDMIDHLREYENEAAGEPFLFCLNQNVETNAEKLLAFFASILAKTRAEAAITL